jgi:31-O-methyltransferase
MTHGAADSGAQHRVGVLQQILSHPDPTQLFFQLTEIAGEQAYLRHGVDVGPGDIVVDVGANVGVAAAFFAALREVKEVHCFEPVEPICKLLRENVKDLPACRVYQQGLSSAPGRVPITYYPGSTAMSGLYAEPERDRALVRTALSNLGFSEREADERLEGRYDEPETLTCELRTLSSVLREERIPRVDLLKIDVERAELDVLGGIEEADWAKIEQAVIEVHDEEGRLDTIAAALGTRGFQVAAEQDDAMRDTSVWLLYATRR